MGPLAIAMIQIVVGLIITAIAARIMTVDGIKKKGLDDFTFPTVDADRAIPVVFGDVLVEGPNVTWFGDYKAKSNKEGGGLFTPDVVVGYNYYLGMELVISWGTLDRITEIWFGENLAWTGDVTGALTGYDPEDKPIFANELLVDAKQLFGGPENGGGVYAECRFYPGSIYQEPDPYMTEQIEEGYYHKGISKLIWYGPSSGYKKSGLLGESNYIQPIKMRVEHYPNFLGSAYKTIGTGNKKGANPAEVVYCLLIGRYANVNSTQPTVPVIPDNLIDTATFLSAAETLYNEGYGISFQWQRDSNVRDLINEIMHHVDGYLSEDTHSGEIRFVLSRQDYDPNLCPVFDETNIVDFTSYVRINPMAAVNRLTANFTDPDQEFKSIPIMVEDLGNVYEQEMGAPGEIDLNMFHDVDTAIERTTRELIQLSEGIVSGAFTANREAYSLNIGDPIKITWEGFGVNDLLVRVIEKTVGSLDDRKVEIKFVQDIFGIGSAIYGTPGGSTWSDIYTDPQDITDYKLFEAPRWLSGKYGEAGEEYQLFLLTKFPTSDMIGYEPYIQINDGGYVNGYGLDQSENDHSNLALDYKQSYGPSKDTIHGLRVIGEPPDENIGTTDFTNIEKFFYNWVLVNDELMAYESVSDMGDGTYRLNNVYRALADTSAKTHVAGDRIWYLNSSTFSRLDRFFTVGEDIDIKTVTTTGGGVLDLANAGAKTLVYDGRYDRPICPGNVTINGGYYPEVISGPVDLTWGRRNREGDTTLTKWGDVDETPEVGQTTTLKIYNQFGVLVRTVTGLPDSSYSYTYETEILDCGFLQDYLTVELYSVRDGLDSFSKFNYKFQRIIENANPVGMELNLTQTGNDSASSINFNLDTVA